MSYLLAEDLGGVLHDLPALVLYAVPRPVDRPSIRCRPVVARGPVAGALLRAGSGPRAGILTYSLTDTVTDGIITAPRWAQHLVKVATSFVVFAALFALGVPLILAGVLGGPALWLALAVREHFWPSDPATYPFAMHVADWWNDCALATLGALAPALYLAHRPGDAGLLALDCICSWLVVTMISYATQRSYARP